ncbi:PTS systemsucrose-specific IIB /IIC / IIA component [Vibrio maritimus]|uniref:PTS systemsucrose-specific IIB /IIC / IIA component n=1 Tax=Vibrio maritimus TaxID=990268 RepID=A0A090RZ52_9VIBR|nr:PTS systemsucrose-specific IIB /IIC / IIA component [Vibrio maritimus]
MMNNEQRMAAEIYTSVGGKENIRALEHCATRLRIILNDDSKADKQKIESISGVKGYFLQTGQHQIILGGGLVEKVYAAMGHNSSGASVKDEAYAKMNWLQKSVRILADVFIPIIPVIVAAGLLMGLRNSFFSDLPENVLVITQILTDTAFIFLPALVVWSTFKRLGGTDSVGFVLGLMTVAPQLPNAYAVGAGDAQALEVLGFSIVGFQGMVLPALVTGIFGAKLEQALRKVVPNALALVVTPFLTVTISILVALFAIGPIVGELQSLIMSGITYVIELPYGIGGFIFAPLHQLFVIMGLHHSFIILEFNYLGEGLGNPLNPMYSATGAAMIGAGVAAYLKVKSAEDKGTIGSSILSTSFGIGEPLLYGVVLKNPKLWAANLVGCSVGGGFVMLVGLKPSLVGVTLIPAIPAYIGQGIGLYMATIASHLRPHLFWDALS